MTLTKASSGKNLGGWLVAKGLLKEKVVEAGQPPRLDLTWLGHAFISGSVFLLAIAYYITILGTVDILKNKWHICDSSPDRKSPTSAMAVAPVPVTNQADQSIPSQADKNRLEEQRKRLQEQVKLLTAKAESSCDIAKYYFSNRMALLSVSSAAGIVFLVCLGITSRDGWEKTNNAIINAGAAAGLTLFTLTTYGQLYGQGKNYEDYRQKYVTALDAQNIIQSAIANGSILLVTDAGGGVNPPAEVSLNTVDGMARLIRYVDDKLALVNRPEFNIDSSFADATSAKVGTFLQPQSQDPQPIPVKEATPAPGVKP
jgi:hypothetical protein